MVFGDEALMFVGHFNSPQCWSQGGASGRQVRHWLCHWVAKKKSGIILMVGHPASLPSG